MALKESIQDIIDQVKEKTGKGTQDSPGSHAAKSGVAEPTLDPEIGLNRPGTRKTTFTRSWPPVKYEYKGSIYEAPVTARYSFKGACSYCGKLSVEHYEMPASGLIMRRCNAKACADKFATAKASE